jgi:hypothetical protein
MTFWQFSGFVNGRIADGSVKPHLVPGDQAFGLCARPSSQR